MKSLEYVTNIYYEIDNELIIYSAIYDNCSFKIIDFFTLNRKIYSLLLKQWIGMLFGIYRGEKKNETSYES